MDWREETVEFRKQVFFLALAELIKAHPDWSEEHTVIRAEAMARMVSPIVFDPNLYPQQDEIKAGAA
ncbi:MAG: hypothetical protein KJ050_10555 [Candidatus Omnitrophica bacterium]|nr:hypothetical protein [Candidatus Omnitrophota bacterium]